MSKTGTGKANIWKTIRPLGYDQRMDVRLHKYTNCIGSNELGNFYQVMKYALPDYGRTNTAFVWVDEETFNNL